MLNVYEIIIGIYFLTKHNIKMSLLNDECDYVLFFVNKLKIDFSLASVMKWIIVRSITLKLCCASEEKIVIITIVCCLPPNP